jgi:hypothetical protein
MPGSFHRLAMPFPRSVVNSTSDNWIVIFFNSSAGPLLFASSVSPNYQITQ